MCGNGQNLFLISLELRVGARGLFIIKGWVVFLRAHSASVSVTMDMVTPPMYLQIINIMSGVRE